MLATLVEKAMAPHSSTLAWKIPWTEEPGRLSDTTERLSSSSSSSHSSRDFDGPLHFSHSYLMKWVQDFLGSPVVRNPPANAGGTGSIPGPRVFHMLWGN